MNLLRILYVVCWRNRLLIPLIISCATFAMVVTMFYHGSSEEPNIPHQTIKILPRVYRHKGAVGTGANAGDPGDGTVHGDPLAESMRADADQQQQKKKKKGSNIPDPDDLAKKLKEKMDSNHKKLKDNARKEPGYNRKEKVVNPEQGKFDVGKDKWRRNRPNMENNVVFPQPKPVDTNKLELPSVDVRKPEKTVNNMLAEANLGKSKGFSIDQAKPVFGMKNTQNLKSLNDYFKAVNDQKNDKSIIKPKMAQDSLDETGARPYPGGNDVNQPKRNDANQEKAPSLREIIEKNSVDINVMNGNRGFGQGVNSLNGSQKANNSVLNLKPIIFKHGMPISAHKHKKKVVNFDLKPHKNSRKFIPIHSRLLYRNSSANLPDHLIDWLHDEEVFCESLLKAYHGEFAFLKSVVLDTNFAEGHKGGESISSVINQPEEDEYYQYMYGFFQFPCAKKPDYFFNNNNHINQWLQASRTTNIDEKAPIDVVDTKFTVAVVRYEYVNIYHSMTDFYNAFLMMEFFNKTQTETNILVIDGHPKGTLDGVWDVLFNSSKRIGQLPKRTKYTNLVWGMLGYNSPMMDHYAFKLPLVEEFRRFFLSSYRVNDSHKLSCDHLTITFIWRRDYVAHPRNPTGTVSRKIANEEELVETLHEKYPNYTIQGMQIDLFDMRDQLQTIAHSDILIGMHGAGLTHALFLPSHGGLVELLPVYWAAANEHFEAIARWRKLLYQRWVNVDSQYEIRDHVTKIPPEVLTSMVTSIISDMCGRVSHRAYPGLDSDNT